MFSKYALAQLQAAEDTRASMVTVSNISTRDQQERVKEGSVRQESKADQVSGLLATLCEALLGDNQSWDGDPSLTSVLSTLEYVESPLAKLKRAGLGLLSQGFGAFGFGGGGSANPGADIPSPRDKPVIIIFVAGGICQREIAQVRKQVSAAAAGEGSGAGMPRIVLSSNRLIDAPELASGLFSTAL